MTNEHTKHLWETYPILYLGRRKSLRESLVLFGFECMDGWFKPIDELSAQLEALNIANKKYGIVIEAVQVKEKFGTLHFYFGVTLAKPSLWRRILSLPVRALAWLFRTDFVPVRINERVDEKGFRTWDTVWHPRWRYAIHEALTAAQNWIEYASVNWREKEVVMANANIVADRLVHEAEEACYNVCEECGHQIGTEWSPRCETQGWINYLCDKCAENRPDTYSKTDAKTGKVSYFSGKDDITKEYLKALKESGITPKPSKVKAEKPAKKDGIPPKVNMAKGAKIIKDAKRKTATGAKPKAAKPRATRKPKGES